MAKRFLSMLICIIVISALIPASLVLAAAVEQPVFTSNKRGGYDGFDYELWNQRNGDAVSMTLTGGGKFECSWAAENILFRTGKKMGSTKTYKEYGDITMRYAADYNITKGDVSYLCVYGWTENPLVEFYIIESRGNYKPGADYQGSYQLDGGTYDVYTNMRIQQPSIQGTKTFPQYFAIRTDMRTEGTISISGHFKEWEDLGLDMNGKMYEVSLCVEGYNSAGNADVYKHVLTIGDDVYGSDSEAPETSGEPIESTPAVPLETASEWAREGIASAIKKGYVPADLQDKYQSVITRQEFCRMAVKFVEYKTGKSIDAVLSEKGVSRDPKAFSDTSDPDILAAYALNITSGTKAPANTSPGTFTPGGEFSREQAATMIRNVCQVIGMDISDTSDQGFTDIGTASAWAADGINFVLARGIMGGTSTTALVFSPKKTYTRQESIVTFDNFQ